MAIITTVGIHQNISNEDYHASPGISNSSMSLLLPPSCPKMFWYEKLSGNPTPPPKEKKHLTLGNLVHTLALEPELFHLRYLIQEDFLEIEKAPLLKDLVAAHGKEEGRILFEAGKIKREADEKRLRDQSEQFLNEAKGREIITQDLYIQASAMAQSLRSHAVWNQLQINDGGCVEYSLMWKDDDTGVLLRSRPDFYNPFVIVDVKTTKDCTPFSFARSIADYAYHRQGALACDGLTKLTGNPYDNVVLFVVAQEPPYLRQCYILADAAIEQGRKEYKQAAEIYQSCIVTDVWEGYPEVIENIDLPNWKYRSQER